MRAGKRDAGVGVRNRCGRAKLEQPSTRSSRRIPTRPDGASLCPTLAFAAPTARGIAPVPCASTYDDSARQLPSYGYGCGPWYGLYITVCSCTFLWTRGASLGADVSARPTWTGRQPVQCAHSSTTPTITHNCTQVSHFPQCRGAAKGVQRCRTCGGWRGGAWLCANRWQTACPDIHPHPASGGSCSFRAKTRQDSQPPASRRADGFPRPRRPDLT